MNSSVDCRKRREGRHHNLFCGTIIFDSLARHSDNKHTPLTVHSGKINDFKCSIYLLLILSIENAKFMLRLFWFDTIKVQSWPFSAAAAFFFSTYMSRSRGKFAVPLASHQSSASQPCPGALHEPVCCKYKVFTTSIWHG